MLQLPEKQQEVVKKVEKRQKKSKNKSKNEEKKLDQRKKQTFKTIPFLHITTQTMKHTKSSVLFLVQPWQ